MTAETMADEFDFSRIKIEISDYIGHKQSNRWNDLLNRSLVAAV